MYWSRTGNVVELLSWLLLCSLCWLGGLLLSAHAFRLRSRERLMSGLAIGLLLFITIGNLLAHLLPLPFALWGAGGAILGLGLAVSWRSSRRPWLERKDLNAWPQLLIFSLLLFLFAQINRGLAIFDDYYNLPIVSMIAAGDIPPHFHLDASQWLSYHYGLHLFAASMVRIGGFFPWSAFDFGKALSQAIAPMLVYLWVRRVTRSNLAGILGGALVLLGGGARWLLLFFPKDTLAQMGTELKLLGSAAASGYDLYDALGNLWKIEGGGPFPFPFAFANGIFQPIVLALASPGALPQASLALLLLISRRKWQILNGLVFSLVLASIALTAEHLLVFFVAGVVIAALIQRRRSPIQLWNMVWPLLISGLLALFGGGVITEMGRGLLGLPGVTPGSGEGFAGFTLQWPPALLSAHLGQLSLFNFSQIIIALTEIGPVVLLGPWVIRRSWRAARRGEWIYSALGLSTFIAFFFPFFLHFEYERDISRLVGSALFLWLLLGFPFVWLYLRQKASLPRFAFSLGCGIVVLGGLVLLGVELITIPRPQLTYFAQDPDAMIAKKYWNRLEVGAQVLDPTPFRAVTVLGIAAGHAYQDTYVPYPEWQALVASADPMQIADAGYQYIYMDKAWWQSIRPQQKQAIRQSCVKQIAEMKTDDNDFRWLLDIRACR